MTNEEREQRNLEIRAYKAQGHTNKETADRFGLHKDTVKVICKGVSPQNGRRKIQIDETTAKEIRAFCESGNSRRKTAEKFDVGIGVVKRICAEIPSHRNSGQKSKNVLVLIDEGYTAQEIAQMLGCSKSTVYSVASKNQRKAQKAHAKKHEEMRLYKAEGHTMGEVAEKFGVSKGTAQMICKGIASQKARPPKGGYNSPNKGVLQDIENVKRIIEERAPGFEFAGNYTGSDGHVDLRCKTCGHIRTARWSALRFHGASTCQNCERIEREKRDAEEKERKAQEKQRHKIEQERKRRGQEAIRMLKRVKKLHRCPVCGAVTDNKIYCSTKCYAKASEAAKDANRRKKIQSALVDKGINLEDLFKRDNGICAICGGKCDWSDHTYRGRYFVVGKTYPSIDHIIPLVKGGEHSWANVQLAHHRCNSAKGAKIVG